MHWEKETPTGSRTVVSLISFTHWYSLCCFTISNTDLAKGGRRPIHAVCVCVRVHVHMHRLLDQQSCPTGSPVVGLLWWFVLEKGNVTPFSLHLSPFVIFFLFSSFLLSFFLVSLYVLCHLFLSLFLGCLLYFLYSSYSPLNIALNVQSLTDKHEPSGLRCGHRPLHVDFFFCLFGVFCTLPSYLYQLEEDLVMTIMKKL